METLLQDSFLSEPLRAASISLLMAAGDQELIALNSRQPLIPASNTKLFISAAALLADPNESLFPPLQTFAHGSIEQGVLAGNLILDSCGSLIFSVRYPDHDDFEVKNKRLAQQVEQYAQQLLSAGIRTINGDIQLSFERWNASPENAHYPAAAAFSFNENTVDTLVEGGVLQTVPERPAVFTFERTMDVKHQEFFGSEQQIRYNPEVRSNDFWRLSNASAIEYSRSMLKQGLREQGIKILEQNLQSIVEEQLLFETATALEIAEFIQPLNKYSDNFRAELLALLLNRASAGSATYKGLNKAIHGIFANQNLTLESLFLDDGSGLSRDNQVSASDIIRLLQFMETQASFESFKTSLAIAGKTGTLKGRFKGTSWEGTFYGKTGTLNGVSVLSGYWFRKNKPTITFAFIGNGAEGKTFWKALETFVASLNSLD